MVAMPVAGALVNLYGSARLTMITGMMFAASVAAPSLAPDLPPFIAGGVLLGASIGSMDVAMNAHGLLIERALRRPVMSGFHGGFSIGAAIGTIGGAWLLGAAGPAVQLAAVCGPVFIAMLVCSHAQPSGPGTVGIALRLAHGRFHRARPSLFSGVDD